MPGQMITELLSKVAVEIVLSKWGELGAAFVGDPRIEHAVRDTAAEFGQIEGLRESLSAWSESRAFSNLLSDLVQGRRQLVDDSIVDGFVEATGFFKADETRALAAEVLASFARNLEEQVYSSEQGVYALAQRAEVQHREVMAGLRTLIGGRDERAVIAQTADTPRRQDELEFHARVDEARHLIRGGRSSAAREVLERVRADSRPRNPTADLRYRIAVNLSACAMQLEDIDAVKIECQLALDAKPGGKEAATNLAVAHLISGNAGQALSLAQAALAIDDRYPPAVSAKIQALGDLGRDTQIDQMLEDGPWMESDPECSFARAALALRRGDYRSCALLCEASIQQGSQGAEVHRLLALSNLIPTQRSLMESTPLPWRIPADALAALETAERELTQSIQLLEGRENDRLLLAAMAERALTRILLGRNTDALTDVGGILARDPQNLAALACKGQALVEAGKNADAVATLSRIPLDSLEEGTACLLAVAYLRTDRAQDAIDLLQPLRKDEHTKPEQLNIAYLLAEAYNAIGADAEAEALIASLLGESPSDPLAVQLAGQIRASQKSFSEAAELLQKAEKLATGAHRDQIIAMLGDLYYAQRLFAEAADAYRAVVDETRDNPLLQKYVVSLYNAGSLNEALRIARDVRSGEEAIPVLSEIEALVLEQIGDIDTAMALRRQLAKKERGRARHLIRVALMEIRRGAREGSKKTIESIPWTALKDDPESLVYAAQARMFLGMEGALALAYRARRLDFRNPRAHLAYLSVFLGREQLDAEELVCSSVRVGTTVVLARENEKRIISILRDDEAPNSPDEIGPGDPLASKLIGLDKGDTVEVKKTPYEELSYTVEELKTNYVHAFQETLGGFSTWFPDHPALHRVEIRNNDFSKIFAAVESRSNLANQVMDLYSRKVFPIGAVASLLSAPIPEVWAGIVGGEGARLLAASGSPQEMACERAVLSTNQFLVLDMTALLTLEYLGITESFCKAYVGARIPQQVLDELNEAIARGYVGARPAMVLHEAGGRFYGKEVTPEDYERGRAFLISLRAAAESQFQVSATPMTLDLPREKLATLDQVLGRAQAASILLAKGGSALLFSDDLPLRQVARSEWGVESVWTESVLNDLRRREVLTDDEFYEALRKLVLGNYSFVSYDSDFLFWVLERNRFQINREVTAVTRSLRGPGCEEDGAVRVAADFIKKSWLALNLPQYRLSIINLMLETLSAGRSKPVIAAKLKVQLHRRFGLLPLDLARILGTIDGWLRLRAGGE